MSKIFISHSSSDNPKALAVAQWLEQQGWADYFLDIDPKPIRGLLPGERWQEALKRASDRCEAVVFLISPTWRDSKWCLAEFFQAKQLGKPVFGLLIEPTPLDSLPKEMTAEWQLCDLVTGQERQRFQVGQDQIVPPTDVSLAGAGLAKLKQGLQKAGLDPSFFPWPPPNDTERLPYRGLKALEVEDAAVFFGREAPVIRGLDTLRRMVESGEQFLVILGASGAGKSSFLRAGLWPRLKRDDRHFLPLPVVRPERTAISGQSGLLESLERTLREYKVPKTRASLRETLAKPDGLVELLIEVQTLAQKRLGPRAASPTVLIGIDQAEELFSKEDAEEAGHLLDLLGKLIGQASDERSHARSPAPRVMVIAAIRSDSYERLQMAPALTGIRQTPFNLPPLAPAEYKMVIEGPAARSTASEWEYAARSGAKQETWAGTSEESQLGDYVVFLYNSGYRTAEVGTKQANGFGLHDLSGNVWEWVEDCVHGNYQRAPVDGSAWLEADGGDCGQGVIRGGSWYNDPEHLRVSHRYGYVPADRTDYLGFRLAQDIEP